MKTKSLIVGLLLSAGLYTATFSHKATADNPHKDRAFAVISFKETNGAPFQTPNGTSANPLGLMVNWAELSAGCPHVAKGDRLADHVANYLEQGFTILFVDGQRIMFVR